MPSVVWSVWSVGMHNVLKIGLVVRREPLTITLSVEGCTDLKNIVHFHSMRVTKFCIRGGKKDELSTKRGLKQECGVVTKREIYSPQPIFTFLTLKYRYTIY